MSEPVPYMKLQDAANEAQKLYQPHSHARQGALVDSLAKYKEMYERSIANKEEFWTEIANQFYWDKPWDAVAEYNYDLKGENKKVFIEWFKGASTNICYNAVDKHVIEGKGDRVAFYWEGNEMSDSSTVTYAQLLERVQRTANVLKSLGVKKGDTVAIYQPMIVDLVVAMLACARIGAPHSIIFGGFSAEALANRILDAKSNVVFTADGVFRGPKFIGLKAITDDALAKCSEQGFDVKHVIVSKNVGDKAPQPVTMTEGRDKYFHELEGAASPECPVEWVDAEDVLFLLYTSGSTGRPKGVVHTHGGYMVWAATTHKYTFDYRANDIYFCTADIGWITGHSYITYGPLLNCAQSVMFEGVPTYPDYGRFWDIVQKYKVNSFYTAPTAIRALMRAGSDIPRKYDLTSLRILGTVGEPINPEAWLWYHEVIGGGRCSIVDTWWQTETGGHMLTPLPGATPTKPGSATLPMFGVKPALVDKDGNEIEGAGEGYLVIKAPWPGQMRTVYGDHARFQVTYFSQFNGYYCTGDGARRDEDGYYWITGRTDDVISVSGHRIGTAEIEGALGKHPEVIESAVVGIPHELKGEGIYCFVILREGVKFDAAKCTELRNHVRTVIGPFASPDTIQVAPGLPKTRSGKIMRRILRKIAARTEDELGDVSTLADPTVIEQLIEARPALQK
eukprot:m.361734 g.361734  ORF g.361734 m.361734 type:complete len:677 (+) comp19851_c0_seq1:405-2435(+)